MSERLPAPLVVDSRPARSAPDLVRFAPLAGNDLERASAFGALLAEVRAERGLAARELELLVDPDPLVPSPPAAPQELWLPHLFCWQSPMAPALAWERCEERLVEALVGGSAEDAARWARRPRQLLRLLELAAAQPEPAAGHLSLRWLLSHQELAAWRLTAGQVELEHVSLHVTHEEEDAVVDALVDALGMVEIPRPASISVPGRWLQAGSARVHLNSRAARQGEASFPGTAPNHVCLAVADVDASECALQRAGLDTRRAGSLGAQVWVRLRSGMAIELQPLRQVA